MRRNRASTSPENHDGVLDFSKLMAKSKRSLKNNSLEEENEGGPESSGTSSSNSSSVKRMKTRSSFQPARPSGSPIKMTQCSTANAKRSAKPSEKKSPKKSPQKASRSASKKNSPSKSKSVNQEEYENYKQKIISPYLVKRSPKQKEVEPVPVPLKIGIRRRTKRHRSPVYPPGPRTLLPLCVLQQTPEPHKEIEDLNQLLKNATIQIKQLTESINQKEENDSIESVLAKGLLATNNKPIFKKVLRWTIKNCRPDMVKKIEKKLGLKLKKKTREEFENSPADALPLMSKPVLKPVKKIEIEEPDFESFPNLMVNRALIGHNLPGSTADQK